MTIPLPMLWQASLPRVQKFALAVCFSGGLFVTMAGILRCIYIITVSRLVTKDCQRYHSKRIVVKLTWNPPNLSGPRQRRATGRLLGRPRDLRRRPHHQPPHALETPPQHHQPPPRELRLALPLALGPIPQQHQQEADRRAGQFPAAGHRLEQGHVVDVATRAQNHVPHHRAVRERGAHHGGGDEPWCSRRSRRCAAE